MLLYTILFFFYLFFNAIKSYNNIFYKPLWYLFNYIIFLNISFLMSFLFFLILLKNSCLLLNLWIFISLQNFGFCFIRWSNFKIFLICFGFELFWEAVLSMLIYNHIGMSYTSKNKTYVKSTQVTWEELIFWTFPSLFWLFRQYWPYGLRRIPIWKFKVSSCTVCSKLFALHKRRDFLIIIWTGVYALKWTTS